MLILVFKLTWSLCCRKCFISNESLYWASVGMQIYLQNPNKYNCNLSLLKFHIRRTYHIKFYASEVIHIRRTHHIYASEVHIRRTYHIYASEVVHIRRTHHIYASEVVHKKFDNWNEWNLYGSRIISCIHLNKTLYTHENELKPYKLCSYTWAWSRAGIFKVWTEKS